MVLFPEGIVHTGKLKMKHFSSSFFWYYENICYFRPVHYSEKLFEIKPEIMKLFMRTTQIKIAVLRFKAKILSKSYKFRRTLLVEWITNFVIIRKSLCSGVALLEIFWLTRWEGGMWVAYSPWVRPCIPWPASQVARGVDAGFNDFQVFNTPVPS